LGEPAAPTGAVNCFIARHARFAKNRPVSVNIHHLELFFYVAKHGGIMPAVRNIPYGIQQPAVSSQISQLEEHLGVTLFQRRPFSLTPAGEKLYGFIAPFFSNLDRVAAEFQGGEARHFRIGASAIVLRDHLPKLLQEVRKRLPGLKVSLRQGYPAQLMDLLAKDEVDLVVTLIERKPPAGFHSLTLLELPLVLLMEKMSRIKSAEELWRRDKISDTLICLPAGEVFSKNFQSHLHTLGVDWFPGIEASSVDLIETYVANGLGIGVSVAIPGERLPANVRALPLSGFPPAIVGALWRGRQSPLLQVFLAELKKRAEAMKQAG